MYETAQNIQIFAFVWFVLIIIQNSETKIASFTETFVM